jgi:RsmE family RNA methyltransferase
MISAEKHIFSFYYSPKNKEVFILDSKDPLYGRIISILRMEINDIYICFDKNFIYRVIIIDINKRSIINKIVEKKENKKIGKKVSAYVPYLEREYLNEIFYIAGQQGINDITLVKTDLSQIKEYTEKDYIRFEKLMIQGCEQGKQYVVPQFNKENVLMTELIEKKEKIYWFYENGDMLSSLLYNNENQEYSFLCGPERGYSHREIDILTNTKKYHSIKLSDSVLRSVDVVKFASVFFKSI